MNAKDGLMSARALAKMFLDCTSLKIACATMHMLKQKGAFWNGTPWKGSGSVTICLSAGQNCTRSLVGLFITGDSIF